MTACFSPRTALFAILFLSLGSVQGPLTGVHSVVSGQEKGRAVKATPKPDDEKVDSESPDPQLPTGTLHEIAKPLAKLLNLQRKGEKLLFDLPDSYSEANTSFSEIRTKARGGGGGHGSGTFWMQYVSGQTFGGRVQKGQQNFGGGEKKSQDGFVVEFVEHAEDENTLEIQAESESLFLIRISGGVHPFHLQVVQQKSRFSVQDVSGETAFSGQGSSFEDFCRKYPDYVQQRLLNLFRNYGIGTPVTRFNSVTRDHVLGLLTPVDSARVKEFKTAFADLESTVYEKREAATRSLADNFDDWKDVIRFAAGNDQFSIEARSRLQKIIKEKSPESDRQMIALVTAGDLVNDAEYLVWMLSQYDAPEKQKPIINQLAKVTKRDFGADLEQWQKLVKSSDRDTTAETNTQPATSITAAMVKAEGYLPQMAEATANLIRLTLKDGRVALDRPFWASQFNNESIETIVKRIQGQMKKSNLPARWLKTGGHALSTVRHEHVLFEHIQTVIPPQRSNNYYSYGNIAGYRSSSINRSIEQPHLLLQLNLERLRKQDKNGRIKPATNKPNQFRYAARERKDTHLEFSVVELPDKTLLITACSPQDESMFQFHQSPDGKVTCHVLAGDRSQSVQANGYPDLLKNEAKFFQEEIFPVFSRFGVQISKEMGGPLKIANAPAPGKKS